MDGPECAAVSAVRRRRKVAGGRRFSPSIPSARPPSQFLAPDAPAPCSQPPAPFTAPAPRSLLPAPSTAPCSPLPPYVALPNGCELNHSSLKRRRTDLGRCDGDHHEVVADLLQTATIRYATTGRPEARLLRGAALRACHGCDVGSGHATRKSADGLELMQCGGSDTAPDTTLVKLLWC